MYILVLNTLEFHVLSDPSVFFFNCCCFSVCNLQGKYEYVKVISEELETHATVYQPPGHTLHLPSFIRNHGLLTQEHFQQLLRKAKV